MSIRKFKNMYFRGTVEKASDFPALRTRREGMIYGLYFDGVIADPELGTSVAYSEGGSTYASITTSEGHKDPDSENYGKITDSVENSFTGIRAGSEIVINNETRYVKTIGTNTLVLNMPLNNEIDEENAVNEFLYRNSINGKSVYVDADHALNKKLYSDNTAFDGINPGDEIVVLIAGNNVAKRIVDTKTNNGEITLNTPFVGDFSSIIVDEYGEAVPFFKSKTGDVIDETEYENNGRLLLWTETPDGYDWMTLAGKLAE